jgi:hypothetical protein
VLITAEGIISKVAELVRTIRKGLASCHVVRMMLEVLKKLSYKLRGLLVETIYRLNIGRCTANGTDVGINTGYWYIRQAFRSICSVHRFSLKSFIYVDILLN